MDLVDLIATCQNYSAGLICQQGAEFPDSDSVQQNVDWSIAATKYANVDEMPHFVAQHRQHYYVPQATGTASEFKNYCAIFNCTEH